MRKKKLSIENAFIFRRNFRGEKREFNPDGRRTFYVKLDPELADVLYDDGWNVKQAPARNEDEPPLNYLQVEVKYISKDIENGDRSDLNPKIYIVTDRKKTLLDESNVSIVDIVRIKNVDIVINPYNWHVGSKSGIKAFVNTMYVTIEEDPIDIKYADIPNGELSGY